MMYGRQLKRSSPRLFKKEKRLLLIKLYLKKKNRDFNFFYKIQARGMFYINIH